MDYTIEWVYNGCCAEHIDIQIFDINDTGALSLSYDYKTSIYEERDIENLQKTTLYSLDLFVVQNVVHI